MAPSVANHLFENSAEKVDVGVLKTNIRYQDNILNKQAKGIKQMKYALYSLQDKLKRAEIESRVW